MITAKDLADFDALILLVPRIEPESFPKDGRLAIIARFGVGYDSGRTSRPAPTMAARSRSRPDGVRRPVAVSILTFMLALTGKLAGQGPDHAPGAGRLGAGAANSWAWA